MLISTIFSAHKIEYVVYREEPVTVQFADIHDGFTPVGMASR